MKKLITIIITLLIYINCSSMPGGIAENAASNKGVGDIDLLNVLKEVRKSYKVPAMAAALITDRGLQRIAAIGTRKWGTDNPVTINDLWHLGSDTKIMTATLVAILVENGKLKWTTTVSEIFPELANTFDPEFRDVNLLQLLSHQAGLPANLNYDAISRLIPVRDQRLNAVSMAFKEKPVSAPGSTYLYSNTGYIIVGSIIERVTNMDWETAIIKKIFVPLKMTSAGFGGLGTPGKIDQPWGHQAANKPVVSNGPDVDNPPVLGPAGRVHCTIQDWTLFITDQLRGARGQQGLISPQSYQMLQSTHFSGDYALGWLVVNRAWAGGKALAHTGSNTMYFANLWIAPKKNFAMLVCTNMGLDSFFATDQVLSKIIKIAEAH